MNFEIETTKRSNTKSHKKKRIIVTIVILPVITLLTTFVTMYIHTQRKEPDIPSTPPKKEIQQVIPEIKIVKEKSLERPIAIMIDNNIGNALHAGLQDSYINYEIIVEGGLTRIMALYKDKDVPLIGPVRSSRHYFLDYALESDAIYAHFGWSPYAEADIRELNVNNINGLTDEYPYWRDSNYKAPHNVFTSIEKIRSYSKTKNYSDTSNNWKLLNYSAEKIDLSKVIPEEATVANKISIDYSNYQNRSYTYDATNEYYLRYMNNNAHIDKTSNTQLHYKNIIIVKVNNYNLDSEGRQDLDTTGVGEGYYITNGYILPINWTKISRHAKTKYTYSNGTEIKINDGNTFIQIVPITNNINIE